ncbi:MULTISPECIES: tetratricopeptide repeat protein [unclassified Sphingobium]|uniref:tetratricopeptide repeat protein n=1 Tax=unclassified Sphingobium TaxID=2611147 RepID=UPI0022249349|nr:MULTISPECIES: tetratricopeptide repeat protein [unclassified Sphingobium]MCW2412857.1 hypothetical protein [Sphingobium sp. B8D3D]MCW2414845.1 hypothetical protein [Sphingobium sp. B8D3A]
MNFKILIAGGAALAALGCTGAIAQTGGATGSYAATAISDGKLDEAERLLQPASMTDAADPARLINIATVYARTQRKAEAREALMRVQSLPAEQLDLADGASYSSHAVARTLLARLDQH